MNTRGSGPGSVGPPAAAAPPPAPDCEKLKRAGNEAFAAGDFTKACELYTTAINGHGATHYVFSNRAAARLHLGDFAGALADAEEAIRLNSTFAKAFHRKGAALSALGRHRDAAATYLDVARIDAGATWARKLFDAAKKAADAADRTVPVTSMEQWAKTYKHIGEIRTRLCSLATFWNASSVQEQRTVLRTFVNMISGAGPAGLDVDSLTDEQFSKLPMHNYDGVVIPEKVVVFTSMWKESTADEQSLILGDVMFFFTPGGAARASLEAESEEVDLDNGGSGGADAAPDAAAAAAGGDSSSRVGGGGSGGGDAAGAGGGSGSAGGGAGGAATGR